jgi:transposase InsO family protein
VQYTRAAHRQWIERHQGVARMSRKGNGYDQAALESFWSLLKSEALPEPGVFETKARAGLGGVNK